MEKQEEQNMLYVLIALCAVFAGIFLYSEKIEKYVAAVVLKAIASLCFVLIGLLHSPRGSMPDLIVLGLELGFIADILLNLRFIFKKIGQLVFLVGILVFLSGHIAYLAAIIPLCHSLGLWVTIGIVLTVLLIIWMFRQITAKPAFMVFGVIYLGAIMLLNTVSVGCLLEGPDAFFEVFALGAFLFLVSDIILIFNTFGKKFRESFRVTNIVLYYAGQILIAVSLMLLG